MKYEGEICKIKYLFVLFKLKLFHFDLLPNQGGEVIIECKFIYGL